MDERAWDERYSGSELIWTAQPNMFLVREIEGLKPGTALDLACGEGRNSIWLAEHGWDVTGVDFSSKGLEKGRALASQRGVDVAFELHDATSWEPAAPFDLVAVFYLQLPQPGRAQAMKNALGAVAKGGTFLLVAHDYDNIERGYGGPPTHDVLYSVQEVVEMATEAGFVIETAEQAERPVATDDGECIAIDAVVKARKVSA
jgi:SAM-dependent methyltransferase